MLGRLRYTPDEYYSMRFKDVIAAIEGFGDGEIAEMNRLRHTMWASLAAFGGKKTPTPQRLMPLPIDGQAEFKEVTVEEFSRIAERMAAMDKQRMAKA